MVDCGKIGRDFDLLSVGDYFDVMTVVEAMKAFCVTFVAAVAAVVVVEVAGNETLSCFDSESLHCHLMHSAGVSHSSDGNPLAASSSTSVFDRGSTAWSAVAVAVVAGAIAVEWTKTCSREVGLSSCAAYEDLSDGEASNY